jgi:hypothetical protein
MDSPSPLRRPWWTIVLAGALLFLSADSLRHLATVNRVTAFAEAGQPAPALDAGSPTGRRWSERNQILDSTDGYHWVMQTQQMIANGEWRVRHVDYDNAPHGREVHWASPLHWWLAAVAWVEHVVTGKPWVVAVEHAATYATPWLLGIFMVTVVPLTARRFGPWPAALLAFGLVAVNPFSSEYGAGSIDHHGIAASCALLTVFFLLAGDAGFPGSTTAGSARRWFIASGVAGAVGLWINAATQIPVLFGVALGAFWAARSAGGTRTAHRVAVRPETAPPQFEPSLWRAWGFAGGLASLVFYFVEYFPSHLGWRLEVNHPLYALAWAGGGDLLARVAARRQGRTAANRDKLWLGLSALAVALPAVVALALPQTFVVADKFLWTLHVDYIEEFSSLLARLRAQPGDAIGALLVHVTLLPLFALPAVLWLFREKLGAVQRASLALSLAPALWLTLLAWNQVRWLHVSCALWLAVIVALATLATSSDFRWTPARKLVAGALLALVFLPYPIQAIVAAVRTSRNPGAVSREALRQAIVRDFAYWLRRRTGDEAAVVLSGPTASTELIYHGGFTGVGTLYWENLEGLRALVNIYGAATPEQALALVRQRGVTHLVMFPWGTFADESARLARGLRPDAPIPPGAFARDLFESGRGMPDWVRPLVYRLPAIPQFKDDLVLALEVVPGQSAAEAAVRRAQFLAAFGANDDAARLVEEALAKNPACLPALIMRASLLRQARNSAGFAETMQRIQGALLSNPVLETGDRVLLALELIAARERDLARAQLALCWTSATERDLRRLTVPQLNLLLKLTQDLSVSPVDAGKVSLAAGLLADESPRPASR